MTKTKTASKAIAQVKPSLTTREIDFYTHEVYAADKLIATIEHDHQDFETQRWMVKISGECFARFETYAFSESFIRWHHKQGTLPQHIATPQTFVVREPENTSTTDLLDKPFDELTADEWEQLRAVEPVPAIEFKSLSINAQKTPLVLCHQCDGSGCGYCGYSGLTTPKSPEVYAMDGVQPAKYRFVRSEYTVQTTTLATVAYWCFDDQQKLGMVFRVRNHKCMWQNKTDTFYWACGDGKQYDSALDVAQALAPELVGA